MLQNTCAPICLRANSCLKYLELFSASSHVVDGTDPDMCLLSLRCSFIAKASGVTPANTWLSTGVTCWRYPRAYTIQLPPPGFCLATYVMMYGALWNHFPIRSPPARESRCPYYTPIVSADLSLRFDLLSNRKTRKGLPDKHVTTMHCTAAFCRQQSKHLKAILNTFTPILSIHIQYKTLSIHVRIASRG